MDHHREIHVIEVTEAQQLLLAAGELEPTRADLLLSPLDVAALLGRYPEEDHATGEVLEGARVHQPHRGAQHARDLRVVAAGVRGAGGRVGLGMPGDAQAVELADQREGRSVAAAAGHLRAHAGHRQAGARRHPEATERLLHEPGGLHLLESHLGLAADALTERHDLLRASVDRREHPPLQLVPGHGSRC